MKSYFLEEKMTLTGRSLQTHWLSSHQVSGPSIVGFLGDPVMLLGKRFLPIPAIKEPENRVMFHIVVEHLRLSLPVSKLLNHVLAQAAVDALGPPFFRQFTDVFLDDFKVTISGLYSDMSSFIHLGFFWDTMGAMAKEDGFSLMPVRDFSIDTTQQYLQEFNSVFSNQLFPLEGF